MAMGINQQIYILIMRVPGIPLWCSLLQRVYQCIQDIIENFKITNQFQEDIKFKKQSIYRDPSCTSTYIIAINFSQLIAINL